MPQNTVSSILQTRDGYLWLTTSDGLVRFDGSRFTVFDKDNSPGISRDYMTSLYEDREGALWIGADNSRVFRYANGDFTTFTMPGVPAGDWVHAISGDRSGNPWISLNDRVMRWVGGRFTPLKPGGFPDRTWPSFTVIDRTGRGGFYTASPNELVIFNEGHVTTWSRRDHLHGLSIGRVAKDELGASWIATTTGLIQLRNGISKAVPRPSECLASSESNFVSSPVLKLVCFSAHSTLSVIGLNSNDRRSIARLPNAFPRNLKDCVFYEDREGNLWIGTPSQGLYRARKEPITVYSQAQGLRDRNVYTVLEDHAHSMWTGNWPGSVTKFQNGKITNYTKENGLSGEEITSLYEDRANLLWVGAYGAHYNGMRVLRKGHFVAPRELQNLGVVTAIIEDRQNAYWFGTEDKLIRYANGIRTDFTKSDGLASSDVTVLMEDADGDLWFGGSGGLTRRHGGRFIPFSEHDGLPGSNVRSLYQDSEKVIWIGTYEGGLGRFQDGRFVRYTIREGLFSNGVFRILEDTRGNLWMSSNHGIFRVSKAELNEFAAGKRNSITSIAYGKSDGMRNVECNGGHWPAGAKAADGKLWFPTQDGVAVIDPATVTGKSQPPPTVIESCLIDRAAVPIDRAVQVRPGQDAVEIRYTALSLVNSDRIKFRYMLEGLDSRWVDSGFRRVAYYSHVPPGNYTFRVIAANSDGVWNTEGKTLAFAVLAPFYRTWWFAALALLSMGTLAAFAVQIRVREWKRLQATRLAFARQLITSQEIERKRVASELHDGIGQSLAIIKMRALLSLSEPENHLHHLEQLDEIAHGASDAIDELREISYHLRPQHLERLGLRKSIQAMLNRISTVGGVRFSAHIEDVDDLVSPEAQINIYRIVQESANNIVQHANATEAKLTIRRPAAGLEILFEDNGTGFATDEIRSGRDPYRGFGLVGMAERSRMMGGMLTIESIPGVGTTLRMKIGVR